MGSFPCCNSSALFFAGTASSSRVFPESPPYSTGVSLLGVPLSLENHSAFLHIWVRTRMALKLSREEFTPCSNSCKCCGWRLHIQHPPSEN